MLRRRWKHDGWMVLCACCLLMADAVAGSLPDTIDRVRPSVVGVGTVWKEARVTATTLVGTGFVVGDGLHVISNYHVYRVVQQQKGKPVVFAGRGAKAKAIPITLVRADPEHDLALLRLDAGSLPPFTLGPDRFLREGEAIAFTGFPLGMVLGVFPVTHQGIVSAITPIVMPAASAGQLTADQIKRIRQKRFEVYQLDGTAYPGNSGSPVYKVDTGEVIGVINSVFVKGSKEAALEKPSGITFAIPVKYVRALLREKP